MASTGQGSRSAQGAAPVEARARLAPDSQQVSAHGARLRVYAGAAFALMVLLALAILASYYILEIVVSGQLTDGAEDTTAGRLVAAVGPWLLDLSGTVEFSALATALVGAATLGVALFVAVSITPVRSERSVAGVARSLFVDRLTYSTLVGTGALCLSSIPFLDRSAGEFAPGTLLLIGVSVVLAAMAAAGRPHTVQYLLDMDRSGQRISRLRDWLAEHRPPTARGRFRSVAIWGTAVGAISAAVLVWALDSPFLIGSGLVWGWAATYSTHTFAASSVVRSVERGRDPYAGSAYFGPLSAAIWLFVLVYLTFFELADSTFQAVLIAGVLCLGPVLVTIVALRLPGRSRLSLEPMAIYYLDRQVRLLEKQLEAQSDLLEQEQQPDT